ncbi:zinc finger-containing ubiquitin peptidase 1 isoform X2 [Hippocampus comes]|uniref:zinc finger-containing ubiquitin peptidase 1 isoform X2 n=1 Tax=Hippocampus comes TaxID=109280 RepID=UPI00094E2EA6|nr:PREDICTED: zinc finger with UFM1-specific peptidase domain protein isoform X2 [Hippocampus comes]
MLTCVICSEEIMLEEDMKTHMLLSHLENDMHCALCSLYGVSYDELCDHISAAHPDYQHKIQKSSHSTSCCPSTISTSFTEIEYPQTTGSCGRDSEAKPCGSSSDSFPLQERADAKPTQIKGVLTSEGTSAISSSVNPKIKRGVGLSIPVVENAGYLSEQKSPKQKRQASPKNEPLSCPMCALDFSSSGILQEHVELHLQEQHSAEAEKLECPMCPAVCSDSASLQQHVELHLDNGAGSSDSDARLAWRLQQEMEKKRREEETRLEKEQFKKLQRKFGLDGSGGYRAQMEKTMERDVARGIMAPAEYHFKKVEMMESLASGVDDGRTRTQGVIGALYQYYQTECRDCVHVWLSADTDHYCSSPGDKGWGCGYRNFQMLLSSLYRLDAFASSLQDKSVPSIPRVQSMIEDAWKLGLDPQGASHFNHKLQGTRAWIGATEIYVLLTSLGISGRIVDFHQPTGPGGTHPRLFEWVKQYFSQSSRSNRLPPRIIQTLVPPLYLQHQGHSRSIVGLEQRKNGSLCLLLLDPGSPSSDTMKLMSRDTASTAIRHVRKLPGSLKHKQYQVVGVEGVLSAEEKQIRILNSRTLCAERIP